MADKPLALDRLDVKKLAEITEMLSDDSGYFVRSAVVDLYGSHRVRFSRRGRYNPLRVTKIEKL